MQSQTLKRRRIARLVLACGLLGLAAGGPARAATLENLYGASEPVADQSRATRVKASRRALKEVLVRVSGKASALDNATVGKALERPLGLLSQFSYQTSKRTGESSPEAGSRLRLEMSFDASALRELLSRAGLPVWGDNRPRLVVWWALEDTSGNQFLLDSGGNHAAVEHLRDHARRRGLPLVLPLMDPQQSRQVTVSDVWGFFPEAVAPASESYQAEGLLLGRARPRAEGGYRGRWMLVLGDKRHSYRGSAASLEALMAKAMDQVAETLATMYAVVPTQSGAQRVFLKVDEVTTLADYAQLDRYIRGLTSVRAARLRRLNGRQIWYELELDSDLQRLHRILRVGDQLRQRAGDRQFPQRAEVLEYRWGQ